MLPFLLTAREGRLWANRRTVRMNSSFKGVPLCSCPRDAAALVCAGAETGASADVKTGGTAVILFYSGANKEEVAYPPQAENTTKEASSEEFVGDLRAQCSG